AHAHDSDQNRWECSLAAGRWRPVSALPAVSRDCRVDVKNSEAEKVSLKARQLSVDGMDCWQASPSKWSQWHSLSLRGWRLPVAAFLTGRHGSCAFPMRFVTSNSDGRSGWGLHSTRPV